MIQTLSDYDKKCIKWLLSEKYNLDVTEIDTFFEKADVQNIQGWVLAKAPSKPILTKDQIKDINRICSGEPVDYVIGFKDFLGCKIDLSLKPLIPRLETEYWVEDALNKTLKRYSNKSLKVLDIFCGSGCIGIATLKKLPSAKVTFGDISKSCVNQVKINIEKNKLQKTRYKILESDIFENISGTFDIIFANPPYVETHFVKMSKELFYEPKIALNGGQDGLLYVDKFLSQAKNFLFKNGRIYMEFGDNQENNVEAILNKYKYKNYKFKKDQFKKWRYVQIQF